MSSMEDDQNYQFYKEYCRLYYANIILTNRLQQLLNEKKDLQFKLSRLEVSKEPSRRTGMVSSIHALCLTQFEHHQVTSLFAYSRIDKRMRRRLE